MKNFFKAAKVGLMIMVCALFLGIGIKAEAASKLVLKQSTFGYTGVDMSWTDVEGSPGGYLLQYSEKSDMAGAKDISTPKNEMVPVEGLSAGKSYYFTVVSVDADGREIEGTKSDVVEVVTAPITKVASFKQTKAETKAITLSWKKAAGANAYRIYYAKNSANAAVKYKDVGDVSSCKLTLAANTGYGAFIVPVRKSAAGFRAIGANTSGTIDMSTMPSKAVTKLKFVQGGSSKSLGDSSTSATTKQAYFSWTGNHAAQGYEYIIYGNNGKKLSSGTITKYTGTNTKLVKIANKKLTYGQFMKIKIRPYIKVNGKKVTKAPYAECWFAKEPKKATDQLINKQTLSAGVKLSWSKITGANRYIVYARKSSSSKWTKAATVKGTSYVLKRAGGSALQVGVSYDFKIVAEKKVKGKTYKSDANWYFDFGYSYRY